MAFSVNSMGFGSAPCGLGPFGHGPWLTFPHTSDYGYGVEDTYAVDVMRAVDGSEQRALRSRQRGRTLTFNFTTADSSQIADVRSFLMAAEGPVWRFRVMEQSTQRYVVVRGPSQIPTVLPGGVGRPTLSPVTLTVERNETVSEAMLNPVDAAGVGAAYWWRCDALTSTTSLPSKYASFGPTMRIVTGVATVGPPLAVADRVRSLRVTSATYVSLPPFVWAPEGQQQAGAIVQLAWPPPTFRFQPIVWCPNASVLVNRVAWALGVSSFGHLTVVGSDGVPFVTASSVPLTDNEPHVVMWSTIYSVHNLWIDGTLVVSAVAPLPPSGFAPGSFGLCGIPDSGQYLYGCVQDVFFNPFSDEAGPYEDQALYVNHEQIRNIARAALVR